MCKMGNLFQERKFQFHKGTIKPRRTHSVCLEATEISIP